MEGKCVLPFLVGKETPMPWALGLGRDRDEKQSCSSVASSMSQGQQNAEYILRGQYHHPSLLFADICRCYDYIFEKKKMERKQLATFIISIADKLSL